MRRRAAILALAACAAAHPAGAQIFMPAPSPAAPLTCPEILANFARVRAGAQDCFYSRPGAEAALVRAQDAPPPSAGAAPLGALDAPAPWRARSFHLGETQAGDRREDIWTAPAAGGALAVTLRYAIPDFAPADARAFVLAAGAENGVALIQTSEPAPDCAPDIAGFALEQALTGTQAGMGILSACLYLRDGASIALYQARGADMAAEDFAAGLGDAAAPADGPSVTGADARVVFTAGVWRGQWIVEGGAGARVVEADWSAPPEADAVQAFLDAVF